MPADLTIPCSCGAFVAAVRGVSARRGNRLLCYCNDCQSFGHFLGRVDAPLDPHGGADIYQTSPAGIEIEQGADRLACMRLRPGGLTRWYTSCCKSPVGNTMGSDKLPFVGLILGSVDEEARNAAVGPVRQRVFARYAKGELAASGASDGVSLAGAARLLWLIGSARLRGDRRRSPFFEPESGRPVATALVLSKAELQRVEAARDAYQTGDSE
jgi:hypothetical protein